MQPQLHLRSRACLLVACIHASVTIRTPAQGRAVRLLTHPLAAMYILPWLICVFRAGDADAYGTIADCYTDLDQFEQAASYYDRYIQSMNKDGPV